MVIRKEHALALLNAKSQEEKGLACQINVSTEEEPYIELELQNLLEQGRSPVEYTLTYWGRSLVYLLEEMINKNLIKHPSQWDERFRWIGSEIIALIETTIKNGDIAGEETFDILKERGFASQVHEEKKGWQKKINDYAKAIYDIYSNAKPKLEISKELAQYIVSLLPGPAESKDLPLHGRFPILLESMRLISFSVPKSDIYNLSGLGQAVQKTIQNMAPSLETAINEDYMYSIIKLLDVGIEGLTNEQIEILSELAFIDTNGNILPAGEYLIEVYKLWSEKNYRPIKTFDVETLDQELLKTIESVWEKNKNNPDIVPTTEELIHQLIEKPLKDYKHLLGFYGRRINQTMGYQKKEELKKKWSELHTIEHLFKHFYEKGNQWYEKLYDTVKESLYTLEAFNLISLEIDKKTGKATYVLTEFGKKVLDDIKEKGVRDITSTAVKTITITKTQFGAPNYDWYEEAKNLHLVGGGYPTKRGLLYEELSYKIRRLPHLNRFELMILHKLPEYGMFLNEIFKQFDETLKEEVHYGLNKLEARGLLNILPNNAIVLTEAGKLIKKAVAGVPEGFAHPINPIIVRILLAIKQTGNLYEKEQKVRILPKNWEEAIKASGLDAETFEKEVHLARLAGYIGQTSITEAGLNILKALEILNK